MSRHRDFRGNNFDIDEYDSHSNSVTDDESYGASPNTMALYMFDETKSGKSREISNYVKYNPSLDISEDCFPDQDDVIVKPIISPVVTAPKSIQTMKKVNSTPDFKYKRPVDIVKTKDTFTKLSLETKEKKSTDSVNKIPEKTITEPYDPKPVLDAYNNGNSLKIQKPLVSLIVIGHVDAGKSTLMGNLLCQLNYVSEKKLNRYKHDAQKAGKASFAYAWILDESVEERTRGITTDVAQTYFETTNRKIRLLDAPGHKDFIPNMIAGASMADAALLVVNATRGEFESGFDLGGQTREHASLVRVFGISNVLVVVNKMDTVAWDEARYEEICDKLRRFLKSLRLSAQFCPVSGLLGTNMTKGADSQMPWYHGPTLIDLVDSLEQPQRFLERPLRISVRDVTKNATSTIVTGVVEAGGVSAGCKVLCMPAAVVVIVRTIKAVVGPSDDSGTCAETVITNAFDGDQVQLTLASVVDLEAGSVLCHPDWPSTCTNRLRARLLVFGLKGNKVITRGYTAVLYWQGVSVTVRFEKLHSAIVRERKEEVVKKKPRVLTESCSAEVDLVLERPLCIESYDNYKHLGKFTIREAGTTVAGGTVVKLLKSRP